MAQILVSSPVLQSCDVQIVCVAATPSVILSSCPPSELVFTGLRLLLSCVCELAPGFLQGALLPQSSDDTVDSLEITRNGDIKGSPDVAWTLHHYSVELMAHSAVFNVRASTLAFLSVALHRGMLSGSHCLQPLQRQILPGTRRIKKNIYVRASFLGH